MILLPNILPRQQSSLKGAARTGAPAGAVRRCGGGRWGALALALPLGGCGTAPSINLFGAFFPDWMACIVLAVLADALVYRVQAMGRLRWMPSGLGFPLVHGALIAGLTFALWLLLFRN